MSDLLNSASLVLIPSGYKEDVVYSAVPTDGSGDLSFTRASNGTRINSAGLVEVCPWNLLEYSEDFANAAWNKSNVTVTSNDTTAPNGTLTADKIAQTSGGYVNGNAFGTGGNSYIFSVYLKAGSVSSIRLRESYYYGTSSTFNLSSGTASGTGIIESVGNGWYRCSLPQTYLAGEVNLAFIIDITTVGNYYVWGAQLNIGSTAKPYFPTTDRLNVPRLTYQNGGGGCPSLLLEKQSTNLALQSQSFTSPWGIDSNLGTTPILTANYGISPDGTQNASRLQLARTNSNASYSQLYQYPITTTVGQQYTYSVWLKSLSGTPTVTIVSEFGRPTVTVTNEWVRYTGTATAVSVLAQLEIGIFGSTYSVGNSLSADILIWGYQFEQSSYPTSYIPTTSASATRVADACFKTGISSLIGQSQGVMFLDIDLTHSNSTGSNEYLMQLYVGASSRIILYRTSSNELSCYFLQGATTFFKVSNITSNGRHKLAFGYKSGDSAFYIDGVQIDTNATTFSAFSSLDQLHIGANFNPTQAEIGAYNYNQVIVFPTRAINAELASLTTI